MKRVKYNNLLDQNHIPSQELVRILAMSKEKVFMGLIQLLRMCKKHKFKAIIVQHHRKYNFKK
jgi:hypothetical protein